MTLPPHIQAERVERARRKAKPGICPTCHAPILKGLDSDRAGIPATTDPQPVARPAQPGDYALYDGELHYLDQVDPGTAPVHARHTCPEVME